MDKKVIVTSFILIFLISGIVISSKFMKEEKPKEEEKENLSASELEFISCLENAFGGFISTENSVAKDMPLNEFIDSDDKIIYYKGVKTSEDNLYVIVKTTLTYDYDIMKYFENYFSSKFEVYQVFAFDGIYVYLHNSTNDIKESEVLNVCKKTDNTKGEEIPSDLLSKLDDTTKINIKSNDKIIGEVTKSKVIEELLSNIKIAKKYGEVFLCDGSSLELEMLNDEEEVIETIYLWGDGKRILPKSLENGCGYYSIIDNNIDLRRFIEDNTDYIFFTITDYADTCKEALEEIYKDSNYIYYLSCMKSDKVLIHFTLTNQTMTLKYALNNNYIKVEDLKDYEDLLIKIEKENG